MSEDKPYRAARNRYNDKEHGEIYHHYPKRHRKTRPQKRKWNVSDLIGPGNEE